MFLFNDGQMDTWLEPSKKALVTRDWFPARPVNRKRSQDWLPWRVPSSFRPCPVLTPKHLPTSPAPNANSDTQPEPYLNSQGRPVPSHVLRSPNMLARQTPHSAWTAQSSVCYSPGDAIWTRRTMWPTILSKWHSPDTDIPFLEACPDEGNGRSSLNKVTANSLLTLWRPPLPLPLPRLSLGKCQPAGC